MYVSVRVEATVVNSVFAVLHIVEECAIHYFTWCYHFLDICNSTLFIYKYISKRVINIYVHSFK